MNPLVSAIVAVYNGERFLGETLESILAQTYAPLEAIVVDDGSTDGTRAVVESFGERVRYFWQTNQGQPTARNLGVAKAHGEFIAFLDADDVWHPEKTARQVACLQNDSTIGATVTQVQNFWMDEVREEGERMKHQRLAQVQPGYKAYSLLARKTVWNQVGALNPILKHASDTEWFLRAQERGVRIELVQTVLVYRRLHRNNYSRKYAERSRQEHLRVFKAYYDRQRARNAGKTL
ncbi:MAG TPA: glycosyltransferase family A protein [Anaerolineae bacterium]|nr:glycosyltransferase family A protein [Anaerolineae bacterium]